MVSLSLYLSLWLIKKKKFEIWVYLRVSFVRSSPQNLIMVRCAQENRNYDRRADEISRKQFINLQRRPSSWRFTHCYRLTIYTRACQRYHSRITTIDVIVRPKSMAQLPICKADLVMSERST